MFEDEEQNESAQWGELNEHADRLGGLEDRLRGSFPTPDTPAGAAQRIRLAVPTPESVVTIGARGTATSEGRAIGPGGIALRTVENLGIEVHGAACIDADGLTITHSLGAMRLLTQADLGIASTGAMRLGTEHGNLELTAGQVVAIDPGFTVVPDMDVPDAPEVDTAGPRSSTESTYTGQDVAWRAHDAASAISTWASLHKSGLTSGVAAGTVSARTAAILNLVRASWTLGEGFWDSCVAAAGALEARAEPADSHDPAIKLHAAGGIKLMTPSKVSIFGRNGVSVSTLWKASIKGAWEASLKSIGNAKVYGVLGVSIKSLGLVGIKGKATSVAGKLVELKADNVAAVSSKQSIVVQAKEKAGINAPDLGLGGAHVHASAENELTLHSKEVVRVQSDAQIEIAAAEQIDAHADQEIALHVGDTRVEINGDRVRMTAGTQLELTVEPGSIGAGAVTFRRNETVIRGRVMLG